MQLPHGIALLRYLRPFRRISLESPGILFLPYGLTSSRARKGGDSFCKAATSRRENVLCGIHVAVVHRSAVAASPCSYSKTCDTFRATARIARRTGLG